ncbi:enoyl-CoA hydratase/isomerase family protein [Streptomyces corynorhini]|uniref:Enoyl-CoA hydratase/isomerase family protein n=1 Tax=Streptomyces corynorhini TaxID=2282652 RepID=A0A370B8Z8_9ACTN|nr:enoyl-CoA hydratase/isomerase family protein [Streptomyces corynorhini]RDG36849.1 enoyl-CoA hydratase/isomerase family protein [Streptomyces corynorhini]
MIDDLKYLSVEHDDAVVRVRLNSPETGNALSGVLLDELLAVLGALDDHPTLRVLILSGEGADFCLGGDLAEFSALHSPETGNAGMRALANKARRMCDLLANTGLVTLARLHGGVVGAGLGLAVFCDLRVGADDSQYRLPELRVGVPPAWGGITARMLYETGAARSRELLLTSERFDAAKAAELAILHRVVPEDQLDAVVDRWTEPLLKRSPSALRTTKAMLNAYAGAHRLADAPLFDAELMTAAVAAQAARAR